MNVCPGASPLETHHDLSAQEIVASNQSARVRSNNQFHGGSPVAAATRAHPAVSQPWMSKQAIVRAGM